MRYLLKYLVTVYVLRLTMIFFGACFGVGLISGAHLLWGGFFFDFLVLNWMMRPISQKLLYKRYRFDSMFTEKTIGEKQRCFPPFMSAFVLCLLVSVLTWVGLMTRANAVTSLFYSLLILQTLIFFRAVKSFGFDLSWKKDIRYALVLYLPLVVISGVSLFMPIFQTAFELASFSWISALILPVGPVLYLVFYKIAPSVHFRRKTTNK